MAEKMGTIKTSHRPGWVVLIVIYLVFAALGEPGFGTLERGIVMIPYCLNAWCCLLAIFGFAFQHLKRNKPFLR